MEMNYCRRCGTKLQQIKDHIYKCESGHTLFANASPCVGVFFMTPENHVMLSVRAIEPDKGQLDSIGGFLDSGESLEEAAVREIREETGLEPGDYGPLNYMGSAIGYYHYGSEILTVLSAFYWTRLAGDKQPVAADDVGEIVTLALDEIDPARLRDIDTQAAIDMLKRIFNEKQPVVNHT